MSLRLSKPLDKKISQAARKQKKTKTDIVLDAVKKELGHEETKPSNNLFD